MLPKGHFLRGKKVEWCFQVNMTLPYDLMVHCYPVCHWLILFLISGPTHITFDENLPPRHLLAIPTPYSDLCNSIAANDTIFFFLPCPAHSFYLL